MVGSITDPKDGKAVAHTIFISVLVYIVFGSFCMCQAWVHARQPRGISI